MEQYINNSPLALVVVFLVIGFVFLIKGADFFVEGSSSIAKKLKVNHHRADDRCNGNIPSGNCSQCDCIIGAQ